MIKSLLAAFSAAVAGSACVAEDLPRQALAFPDKPAGNHPSLIAADGHLRVDFGEERLVCDGGLQPYLFGLRSGALLLQVQTPEEPLATPRMHYPYALETVVSRDGGKSWTEFPRPAGTNGLNLEGGAVQLADGAVLALDTYITPSRVSDRGLGQLYESRDDWRTFAGPTDVEFELPGADFSGSKDDRGRPYAAERLHRRIIQLPNGDLLATVYGLLQGDHTPSTYEARMMKTRVMLVRSSDRGRHWRWAGTIAADPTVGTEGFGEPVIVRIGSGAHAGRLLTLIRTGRELYETTSDDEGRTWAPPHVRPFAYLDINRTELWVDMFRHIRGRNGRWLDESNPDELKGAVVDPDLLELRGGLLLAAFGVRIPQKACWPHAEHPWNGNYLAISRDHGETWSNVVQMTSGVLTTHYMGVAELPSANKVFVAYDYGHSGTSPARYVYGRTVTLTPQ